MAYDSLKLNKIICHSHRPRHTCNMLIRNRQGRPAAYINYIQLYAYPRSKIKAENVKKGFLGTLYLDVPMRADWWGELAVGRWDLGECRQENVVFRLIWAVFFLGVSGFLTFRHRTLVWASVAASSQTLPMVDGGWGVLWDPNIIWIGHELVLRASCILLRCRRHTLTHRQVDAVRLYFLLRAVHKKEREK